MKSLVRASVAMVAASVLMIPLAPAHAAAPAGGSYVAAGTEEGNTVTVNKKGTKVTKVKMTSGLSQCSPVPYKTSKVKAKIKKNKFVWKGDLTNMMGQTKPFTLKGTFKGKKLKIVATDVSCKKKNRTFTFVKK